MKWRALYAIFGSAALAVGIFFSCQFKDSSDPESIYMACNQPAVLRCNEATGDNVGFKAPCAGDPYATCPDDDRVGSCVLDQGTSQEVTIYYYAGHVDAGKTDCDVQQSIRGGVYAAED